MVNADNDIAVRVYETKGEQTDAKFILNIPYTSVLETNMLFNKPCTINPENVSFNPFEVKTFVIKR